MDRFEKDLRNALRRESPSADFQARLASRMAVDGRRKWRWPSILGHPQIRWAAMATACALILGGFAYQREQQLQRARGESAKQQVMIALRITSSKMKLARTKVKSLSQR